MKKTIIITILLLSFINTCFASTATKKIIVVDAGSSRSTLYVYEYTTDKPLPSSINTVYKKSINPGIASISSDDTTLNNYFNSLFSEANSTFPKRIPVYFYATAGMRLLPDEQQQKYYTYLSNWIRQNTHFQLKDNRTLQGQYEGMYGWVALNYLLHNFDQNKSTAGVIDLGGASTQITYVTDTNSSDNIELTIGDQHYRLHAKSYLGLGQDQARNQFADEAACLPVNYSLPDGEKGQGNFSQCAFEMPYLLNDIHHVKQQSSDLPLNMPFYLVSGLYYEAASKPIDLLTTYNVSALMTKGSDFCSQTWDSLKQTYPDEKYLSTICFNAAYHAALLHDGYGFELNRNLIPINQINNSDIAWTLGVALMHTT